MRARPLLASVIALASAVAVASGSACSSTPGAVATLDASDDASLEAGDGGSSLPEAGPGPDVTSDPCTLGDGVTDPVALCVQQQVLRAELQYAYATGHGVAPGWSSTGPGYAALPDHAWQDDLGLAGALGAFECSASVYGNTASRAAFGAVLGDLGSVLLAELQGPASPLTGSVDGELYFRLRWAEAAFSTVDSATSSALRALADAFGTRLAAHAVPVAPAGDGGSPGGTVIGTQNMDGSVSYAPAQSIMAAAALLDMALLHASDADAGAGVAQGWVAAATQGMTYVMSRGRDPATGLFFQSLVTGGDPAHDALAAATPASDAMLTETQAWIELGLARAQDRLDAIQATQDGGAPDGAAPVPEAYWVAGAALAGAMTAANLFDGTASPASPPPPGAFQEGIVLSVGQLLTNKTTIGNAIMLGGFHRVVVGAGSSLGYQLGELRAALVQFSPAHSSLFTIVTDGAGNPEQQAYLRAGSKSYGYAIAPPVDAGALEPGATNYRSDAVHAMVEGFTQLWRGAPGDARCAP